MSVIYKLYWASRGPMKCAFGGSELAGAMLLNGIGRKVSAVVTSVEKQRRLKVSVADWDLVGGMCVAT